MSTIPRASALSAVLLAALAAVGSATLVAAAPVAAASPVAVPATVTFWGRGYGHGVGDEPVRRARSGARRADGCTFLPHYYTGTALGYIDKATTIRVQVLTDFHATSTTPLLLYARRTDWTMTGTDLVFPKDAKVTVTPSVSGTTTTWRVTVTSAGGSVLHTRITAGFRMTPVSADGRLQVASRTSEKDEYRDTLRIRLSSVARVVNERPLETYLRGVVPAEMPSTWPAGRSRPRPSPRARTRPAISGRASPTTTSGTTPRAQVYRGSEGERATTDASSATAASCCTAGRRSPTRSTIRPAAGRPRTTRTSSSRRPGQARRGPVSYLRGSIGPAR